MREIAWNKYDEQKMKEVMDFSEKENVLQKV